MSYSKIFTRSAAIIILALFSTVLQAQQIYKVSRYLDRSFLHNPAAAGANNSLNIAAVYRSMWSGIDGGPKTVILFGDTYFPKVNAGTGLIFYRDETGAITRTGGEADISYSIKLKGDEERLMFGLGGELIQYKIDMGKIASAITNDPLLLSNGTTTKADASAGIYYRSPKLNGGISVKQLIGAKLGLIKNTPTEGRLYRQYYFTSSYNLRTDEDNILIPHAEIQLEENTPFNFEAGVVLEHKDLVSVGVGFNYRQSYTLFAGIKINHKFSIDYAYDNYRTPLSSFDDGSAANEICLRYRLK